MNQNEGLSAILFAAPTRVPKSNEKKAMLQIPLFLDAFFTDFETLEKCLKIFKHLNKFLATHISFLISIDQLIELRLLKMAHFAHFEPIT